MELPEEIVSEQCVRQVYEYEDLFRMMDDLQRLRRKTGWKIVSADTDQHIIFLIGVGLQVAFFKFDVKRRRFVDWPRSYLGMDKIKNAFNRRAERQLLVQALNEIPQDIEYGEAKTSWQRILDDDIL